jgi:uncharacterized protein
MSFPDVLAIRHHAALAMTGLLLACTPALPINYYLLSPAEREGPAAQSGELTVGLQPIELAAYLERPEIVTRSGANRMEIADLHRWGEQLEVLIARVLAHNLDASLPQAEVLLLPTSFAIDLDRELLVEIDRFDADEAGSVLLDARWQLIDVRRDRIVAQSRAGIREEAGPEPSYTAIAEAMSRAVAALGTEIAASFE